MWIKNEILIQRYSREMSHIKEQLEAKEKCLKEYQHAAQWKAHRDVESLIKEKERLAEVFAGTVGYVQEAEDTF